MNRIKFYLLTIFLIYSIVTAQDGETGWKLVNVYPHNTNHFTQGLLFHNEILYESTGQYSESGIYQLDYKKNEILKSQKISGSYFGEGLTVYDDKLIQLTWHSGVAFVYDIQTFTQIDQFSYDTEGWGITADSLNLYLSDGTATIYITDPVSYLVIDQITVQENGRPVTGLNELEFANGKIYANVWPTNFIVEIEPATGNVIRKFDFSTILPMRDRSRKIDVLNGIAYNPATDTFFITGKYWPKMFEIEIPKMLNKKGE